MKIKDLRVCNPDYDHKWWDELTALSKGGKLFRSHIAKFLPQNAVEPPELYAQRATQAHYYSYMSAITSLYVGWLFSADFSVKARTKGSPDPIKDLDPFYGQFQANVGDETTFSAFTRERFREVLTVGKSLWLMQLPSNEGVVPQNKDEWEARRLGDATIQHVPNESMIDWEKDDDGRFLWVNIHTKTCRRTSWIDKRDTVTETWRFYDKQNVTIFETVYPIDKPPTDETVVEPQSPVAHGFKRVPVICMDVPTEICIGEQTHDPQLEHFRLDNALSWLIRRTCYAQPVFFLEDPDTTVPTMGTGYALLLGATDKQGWTSPPTAPFDVLQKNVESKRDEIFRVTHTMAQSVDNNAETVGRSADSKEIDAAATRIMLQAYGTYVAKAIEETYETLSEARGDANYEWAVEGFSGYDTATVGSLIANATNARLLGIPSQTFHRELSNKVANAMFAGEDAKIKQKIKDEIDTAQFDTNPIDPTSDALRAKAELERAKADSEPLKAKATIKTADASMVTAKKPKPAAKPPAKKS